MEKVKTSISLDKDVYDYIQKLADNERLNLSQIINRYFYQLMKEQEGKR
jgi:predicted DNA-binding ribbon-helix-helix protein